MHLIVIQQIFFHENFLTNQWDDSLKTLPPYWLVFWVQGPMRRLPRKSIVYRELKEKILLTLWCINTESVYIIEVIYAVEISLSGKLGLSMWSNLSLGMGNPPSMLKYWNAEVLKCWNTEMLKYWNAKIVNCWNG